MPVPNCVVCDKLSTFACVDCKTSHYCSINCINKDLPVHQLFCHPLVKFLASTPKPASKSIRYDTASDGEKGVIYRRGLLFPVDSKVPQYIWVKFTQTFNAGQGSIYEEADLLEWLGDRIAAHLTNENLGRATMLHSVQLSHRSDFLFDGSSSNKCIEALSSHGRKRSEWRGPVIALHSPVDGDGEGPQAEDSLEYEDITPEDGRVALNVFVYNTRKAEKDLADCFNKMSVCTASFPETLKGVMISCNGDQHFLRKNKYVEMQVSKNDGIYSSGAVSEITEHMGIPLVLQKRPRDPAWASKANAAMKDRSMPDPDENGKACFLMLSTNTDPDLEGGVGKTWGLPDTMEWDCGLEGSVLVVRKDGKDISSHQVEALVCYCQKLATEMVEGEGAAGLSEEEWMEYDEETERKKFIEEKMCQTKFEKFSKELKRKKIEEGDGSWDAEISPFSV